MKKAHIFAAVAALLLGQVTASAQESGKEVLDLDLTVVTSNVRYDNDEDVEKMGDLVFCVDEIDSIVGID